MPGRRLKLRYGLAQPGVFLTGITLTTDISEEWLMPAYDCSCWMIMHMPEGIASILFLTKISQPIPIGIVYAHQLRGCSLGRGMRSSGENSGHGAAPHGL